MHEIVNLSAYSYCTDADTVACFCDPERDVLWALGRLKFTTCGTEEQSKEEINAARLQKVLDMPNFPHSLRKQVRTYCILYCLACLYLLAVGLLQDLYCPVVHLHFTVA